MVTTSANILIVDDDLDICRLLCEDLSQDGYLCSTALSGEEALIKLTSERFDAVLVDIGLPDVSGIEILKRISSTPNPIRSIVITGLNSATAAAEATRIGAFDFILKPFGIETIRASIQRVLRNSDASSGAVNNEASSSYNPSSEPRLPTGEFFRDLDAIARGVEARYELLLRHSEMVTQEVTDIARRLGLPEAAIQRWVNERSRLDRQKRENIDRSLAKLERSLPAQELLGLMRPYTYTPANHKSENRG